MVKPSVRLRQQRLRLLDNKYELCGQLEDPCVYCGVISDTMDHVPPLHYVYRIHELGGDKHNLKKYPACHDCNSMLSGSVLLTLKERRMYIREKIQKKYKKWLRMPNWDEQELSELSPEMRRDVEANLKYRGWIMERLAWARNGGRR